MVKGIWFGDIHSYANLNLILSKVDLPPATVKETYVDNPGGDGSWDLTEANGKVNYKDRKAKFTFSVLPGDDFEAKKTEVSNLLNGRRFKIVLDKDPEYYWDGRCSINKYESKKKERKIVVAANVAPYKLKRTETVVNVVLSNESSVSNAKGNPLHIDDLSPVNHDMSLKICGITRKCTNLIDIPDKTVRGEGAYVAELLGDFELKSATYTLSFDYTHTGEKSGQLSVRRYGEDSSHFAGYTIAANTTGRASTTFTVPSDTKGVRIYLYINVSGTTADTEVITSAYMLNEGSTALPYEPYFEGLRSASVENVESVGVNLFGGDALADKLVNVASATKDEVNKTVTFTAGNVNKKVLFEKFKPNTRYTFYMRGYNSSATQAVNMSVRYTDGTAGRTALFADGYWYFVSDNGKSIESLSGTWNTSNTTLYYDECGVFEGVLTAEDFTPYVRNTLPIPEAVQSLDGYGWGLNESVYNYIDWEKKQFVKRVGKVDMGTLTWSYSNYWATPALCSSVKINYHNPPLLAEKYGTASWSSGTADAVTMNSTGHIVLRSDDSANTPSGLLYYELAKPEVTDISDILFDFEISVDYVENADGNTVGVTKLSAVYDSQESVSGFFDVTYNNAQHKFHDVILNNGRKSVVPVVECSNDDARIKFGDSVVTLNAGKHKVLDLQLREGANNVSVGGFGTAKFTYQEGDL